MTKPAQAAYMAVLGVINQQMAPLTLDDRRDFWDGLENHCSEQLQKTRLEIEHQAPMLLGLDVATEGSPVGTDESLGSGEGQHEEVEEE